MTLFIFHSPATCPVYVLKTGKHCFLESPRLFLILVQCDEGLCFTIQHIFSVLILHYLQASPSNTGLCVSYRPSRCATLCSFHSPICLKHEASPWRNSRQTAWTAAPVLSLLLLNEEEAFKSLCFSFRTFEPGVQTLRSRMPTASSLRAKTEGQVWCGLTDILTLVQLTFGYALENVSERKTKISSFWKLISFSQI